MRNQKEHFEQVALFNWAAVQKNKYPELRCMFAIPNGANMGGSKIQRIVNGKRMKAEGMKAGVPDICLPVPRKGKGALFIEMKIKGSYASPVQKGWLEGLEEVGNKAVLCRTCEEAIEVIVNYLS